MDQAAQLAAYRYHEKVAKAMIGIFTSFVRLERTDSEKVARSLVKTFWLIRRWFPAHMLPPLSSWNAQGERGLAAIAKTRYMREGNSPTKRAVLPPLRTWEPRIEHERPTDAALDRAEARK